MEYKIRLAKTNDCYNLTRLKRKVWETTYRGIYPDKKFNNYNFTEQEEFFNKVVSNPNINLYVVEVENDVIGYMSCGQPMREFKHYKQEIGLLYLLKEYQRNGIGKKLFMIAYEDIKSKGHKEFFISCNKYNLEAQKFYEAMGGKAIWADEDCEDKSKPQIKYHYDII